MTIPNSISDLTEFYQQCCCLALTQINRRKTHAYALEAPGIFGKKSDSCQPEFTIKSCGVCQIGGGQVV
tara:strand:+ start:91 stop:297 length:207 start_codon:yes stop_codon:yes gene_type:complete